MISLFSAKNFSEFAKEIYGKMLPLVGADDETELLFTIKRERDGDRFIFQTKNSGYWSEWFTQEALEKIMRSIGTMEPIQSVIDENSKKEIALLSAARPSIS